MKRIISGKPSIVINRDGVDFKQLKENNLDVEDLIESMRSAGYFSFDELSYGIFEANGKFSAMANEEIKVKNLPYLLINEGKPIYKNFDLLEKNMSEVLHKLKLKSAKTIEILTMDKDGRCYLQKKGKRFEIIENA